MRKIALILALSFLGNANALTDFQVAELRYCGKPERWANGKIKRSRALVERFIAMYPLPAKYDRKDWAVDHVIPLANGGCDAIVNLQWLPNSIKRTSSPDSKDRWERNVYPKY